MKTDTRWLEWTASAAKPVHGEPQMWAARGFAGFAGPVSTQMESFSFLEAEPAAYGHGFAQWATETCVFRDRAWGGVRALHKDYARWCAESGYDVPAGLRTFASLLRDGGFWLTESGLVYGVLLLEDLRG